MPRAKATTSSSTRRKLTDIRAVNRETNINVDLKPLGSSVIKLFDKAVQNISEQLGYDVTPGEAILVILDDVLPSFLKETSQDDPVPGEAKQVGPKTTTGSPRGPKPRKSAQDDSVQNEFHGDTQHVTEQAA